MLTESERPLLVSVMLANNETGVIQPIREIADMVHRYNGLLHTDASQAVGKVPVNMADMGVDMLTLSAHKFGGAQGAAALIVAPCIAVEAQIKGGGQELGFRAGTQNLAAIVGMGVAVSLLDENIKAMARIQNYRDRLEKEISLYAPNAIVFGIDAQRLPNTSAVSMPGVNSETQLINCDLNGVAVSAGSACSSGKVARSHVLDAMGMDEDSASSVVRVSMGMDTIEKDIETYIRLWKQLYDRAGEKHSIVDAA